MLRNIMVVTFRHFARNLNHTLINILGLSVGIASCIIVFVLVRSELAYDKFNSKFDRIYRVVHTNTNSSGTEYSAVTPYPFINAFREDFTDVPLATSFHYHHEVQLTIGAEKSKVEHVLFADSLFFKVFDFEVLEGDPATELGQPGKVFLTESLAKKILKPGAGRSIKLNNILELEVAGIIKDPPASSHVRFDLVASMPSLNRDFIGFPLDVWTMEMSGYTYVVLPADIDSRNIESRFPGFVKKYYADLETQQRKYSLQPLADIHFNEDYENPADDGGMSRSSLYILSLLGLFLLAVACVNFINLSTALAVKKAREIGVRKTLGANRRQLSRQFLAEALMITMISLTVALVEVEIFTPILGGFLGKSMGLSVTDSMLWPFLAVLIVVTALLAGAYPAWILSRFNPAVVLKSNIATTGGTGKTARGYLVIFQFLVAQVLIIGTIVVSDQMNFLRSKPLGFTSDAVMNIELPTKKESDRSAFLARLQGIKEIEHVSFSLGSPTSDNNFSTSFFLAERETTERFETQLKIVDQKYAETYDLQLAAGRWFTDTEERIASDTLTKNKEYTYVVNEALARSLGFAQPTDIIGKRIVTGLNNINAEVVGVVKDFHTASLHETVAPTTMVMFPYFYYDAGIRFDGDVLAVMAEVERAYNTVYPEYVFNYTFLDQHLESLYQDERRAFGLIRIFAALAIFISCLGLLGLVSFITTQKVKEIGIRKVFGASVASIMLLFSAGFVRLIAIAFAIAAPLGWYLMNQWLEGFAYRTPVGWEVFAAAIVLTTLIAMITVLYQSARAAMANPATSLRSE
jgi:putative ABC transport system permease protein